VFGGMLIAHVEARPADQVNAVDKLKNLELREIGPAVMGGRIDDFAVVESNPNIVFVGVAAGGVWKTTNNGTTWTPVFDKEAVSTIGDIAIAPSDPSVVWVGTGEPNNRQSSSWGDGAYKSLDGGKNLAEHGAARNASHWAHCDSSAKSGCAVRGGAGAFVGAECGARRLQNDGRRENLVASAENK